jgi:hypothetical protein
METARINRNPQRRGAGGRQVSNESRDEEQEADDIVGLKGSRKEGAEGRHVGKKYSREESIRRGKVPNESRDEDQEGDDR